MNMQCRDCPDHDGICPHDGLPCDLNSIATGLQPEPEKGGDSKCTTETSPALNTGGIATGFPAPNAAVSSNAGPQSDPVAPADCPRCKVLAQDWADTDTKIKEIGKRFGMDVEGDSFGVPGILSVADFLAEKIASLEQALDTLTKHHAKTLSSRDHWQAKWNESQDNFDAVVAGIHKLESGRENWRVSSTAMQLRQELYQSREKSKSWESLFLEAMSERDALNAELETETKRNKLCNIAFAEENEKLKAELNACKTELGILRVKEFAKELDACKRDLELRTKQRDAAQDNQRAYESNRDSLQQQLTEKSALCDRLRETAQAALDTFRKEGEGPATCRKLLTELLQRAEGKE